jgi:alkaline phosphatase D
VAKADRGRADPEDDRADGEPFLWTSSTVVAVALTSPARCWASAVLTGQQMLMAQLEQKQGEGEAWWSDGWDGCPAERQRLLAHIAEHKIDNVMVIGGDIHSFWVSDLKPDFSDPASPTVATEFVGTSVTSEGVPYDRFNGFLTENPHIRFFESRERGYVRAEVRPGLWRTDLRIVDTTTQPESTARTLRAYAVEPGKAGAQLA